MNDEFLVKFALGTLVFLAFVLQHGTQILARMIKLDGIREKNVVCVAFILLMQMCSAAIIIEIIRYALKK